MLFKAESVQETIRRREKPGLLMFNLTSDSGRRFIGGT